MNTIKKYHSFFLLLFHFAYAGLFSCFAQTGFEVELISRVEKFGHNNFQEKIFVHTGKSFYICGEILWFKLYNTDAILNKPANISRVAYVELLNKDKRAVMQAKIELNEGTGSGSLMLPYSLNSGNYVLRSYTNWMKNFDPEFYFESSITIINTFKKLGGSESKTPAFDAQFFPEGGNLVNRLESKVAFHAVDKNGHGISCNGLVINQNNDSITSFQSLRFGMGHFKFTPSPGNSYKAVIQSASGNVIVRNLPTALETGYVMNLIFPDKGFLKLIVRSAKINNEPVYLLIHTRNIVKLARMEMIKNSTAEFTIKQADLGEGISHFTVFNSKRQPVCERLFFHPPKEKLNLTLIPNQQDYSLRKNVSIELKSQINNGKPASANISLSVFPVDSLHKVDGKDIRSFLWLTSELHGTVESPDWYFNNTEENAQEEAVDNLMLTHGWSRFKWEEVLKDKQPSFRFLPEYEGHQVMGKIKHKNTGLPLQNITTYLTIPGERFIFRTSGSDQNGNIFFSLNNFYGNSDIVIQASGGWKDRYTIDIPNSYSGDFSSRKHPLLNVDEKNKDLLLDQSVGSQVENIFVQEEKHKFTLPKSIDTTTFYGKPDKSYLLDDYTRFITMEEVLKEYVVEVRIRKSKDQYLLNVKNEPYHNFFENNPLVVLDGLPVFDMNKLMELDPLKIKKLDIITRKYFSGNDMIEGIVSIQSYKGDLAGFQINPDALVLDYPGLQLNREFYSPIYDTREKVESRVPDFRNLLYWEPEIKIDKNGFGLVSFYTSDKPGRYAIVAQGINADGVAGSAVHYFNVSK